VNFSCLRYILLFDYEGSKIYNRMRIPMIFCVNIFGEKLGKEIAELRVKSAELRVKSAECEWRMGNGE